MSFDPQADICTCTICNSLAEREAVVDPAQATPQMAPFFNDDQVIGQIDSGRAWSGSTISYGFPNSAPSWTLGAEGNGFARFSNAQKAATRDVMELWDDLIVPSFNEVTSSPQFANVTFANTTTNIGYAHAYYPGGSNWSGSVWLNSDTYTSLYSPNSGSYAFMTILHEVGHAIGLSHPGNYNGGRPTYANDAVYAQDTHQWTVMSYFSASNTGADWNGGTGWQYAQTPMVHDVLTIQDMYGADTTTRTGNTVYGFNSNAGNSVFDFSLNKTPVLTIYDAGGIDTLDLSGFSQRAVVNLAPGTYSSAGGVSNSMTYNIGIAGSTIIENAIGGSANDVFYGNSANNVLTGGGGNDVFHDGAGSDRYVGGSGTDSVYFDNAYGDYTFGFANAFLEVIGSAVDYVSDTIETVFFSDRSWDVDELITATTSGTGNVEMRVNLVDADTGQVLSELQSGARIDPGLIAGRRVTITAETVTGGDKVESVRFDLNNGEKVQTENLLPYALFGDNQGDMWGQPFGIGTYNVSVDAFSQQQGGGQRLSSVDIDFTIASGPAIDVVVKMVDADTGQVVTTVNDGDTIDAALVAGRRLTFTAEVTTGADRVESIRFDLNDGAQTQLENLEPYALFGDASGDFWGEKFTKGTYDLDLDLYSQDGGGGTLLDSLDIDFTIATGGAVANAPAPDPVLSENDDLPLV